jgi:outer membrane protein assembly factor BamB
VKWVLNTTGDVPVNPAIVTINGVLTAFFPDMSGSIYAVNAASGSIIWQKNISDYTGLTGSFSRTAPVYDNVNGNFHFARLKFARKSHHW